MVVVAEDQYQTLESHSPFLHHPDATKMAVLVVLAVAVAAAVVAAAVVAAAAAAAAVAEAVIMQMVAAAVVSHTKTVCPI